MKRLCSGFLGALLWIGASACGGAPDGSSPDELDDVSPESVEQASFIQTSSAWPMASYGKAPIAVCWETAGYEAEKEWVRSVVTSRYNLQPFFHVKINGWRPCAATGGGVRIQIADAVPKTLKLGKALNNLQHGMSLNFTFNNWFLGCSSAVGGDAVRKDCIERTAMHEFGHALGLADEQKRVDKPDSCEVPFHSGPNAGNPLYVGKFDSNSLMSACSAVNGNPAWYNRGQLSSGDVAGLARLYGGGGDVFVASSTGASFASARAVHDWFCVDNEVCLTGDFNGDGKQDLVTFVRGTTGGTTGNVYVALSTGTGFTGTGWLWHDNFCIGKEVCKTGDFNGDGKDDIAAFTNDSNGDVFVALSTGSSFGPRQLWHDGFCLAGEVPDVGDFNGDGKDDIVTFVRGSNPTPGKHDGNVYVALSTGTNFDGTGVKWHEYFAPDLYWPMVGDFNGDGKADIMTVFRGSKFDREWGDVYVALSNGALFGARALWTNSFDADAIGDLNGDGKADLVSFVWKNPGDVWTSMSTGVSFSAGQTWTWGLCLPGDNCLVADVTGDRRADAIVFKRR